jgi:hypothetical protein
LIIVGEREYIAFGETGEVPKRVFENGFWVADVKERRGLCLELDELAGGKICGLDLEEITGL